MATPGPADIDRSAPTAELPCYGKPLRAMTGKYWARNPALVAALTFFDLLGKLHRHGETQLPVDRPIRLLIVNWAHLGDVVAILPLLEFLANQPRIGQIGILVGSWSECIVSKLPFVKKIHYLDHFLLDRASGSKMKKMCRYFIKQHEVVKEIRNECYDVSVDLFMVFPSTHRLLCKVGIPTRIGFTSTGLGTYLTHAFDWPPDDEYILVKQLKLLQPIFGAKTPKALPPTYPGFKPSNMIARRLTADRRYVLMHIGAGDYRSWPLSNWVRLGQALMERGREIVFTGAKGSEAVIAGQIADRLGAQSVAGSLSWNEFVTSVANASLVISVDTVTGHLAACFGIPTIIFLSGRWGKKFFGPNDVNTVTLTHPVGCAPCYRSKGCETMACVKHISTEDVLAVCDQIARG